MFNAMDKRCVFISEATLLCLCLSIFRLCKCEYFCYYQSLTDEKKLCFMEGKRSSGFCRIFTLAFLKFLAPAGGRGCNLRGNH